MLFKKLKNSTINKILVISLSNIGDVILTCPVIDSLIDCFPTASISVIVGPKAQGLFDKNPYIQETLVFQKQQPWHCKARWTLGLREKKFDMVIDLRNTAIPLFLDASHQTPLVIGRRHKKMHMRDKHFALLKSVVSHAQESKNHYAIFVDELMQKQALRLIADGEGSSEKFYTIGAGSANPLKRWTQEGFVRVIEEFHLKNGYKVVFVGDQHDFEISEEIIRAVKAPCVNLCGKTSLIDLAGLLRQSQFVLANDSAISHLASYFDVPLLTLFGPSDPQKYGPWGLGGHFLASDLIGADGQVAIKGIDPKLVVQTINEKFFRANVQNP